MRDAFGENEPTGAVSSGFAVAAGPGGGSDAGAEVAGGESAGGTGGFSSGVSAVFIPADCAADGFADISGAVGGVSGESMTDGGSIEGADPLIGVSVGSAGESIAEASPGGSAFSGGSVGGNEGVSMGIAIP